eukprot:CAMPEP_0202858892 /NCGR_PEP_ID=MMETSP1391-20130828/1235_1 /ASSEMBLY_ACC=CAM_ASM_000867 /TAXON_ID=1034604 /ORGANISM="Chlamydomonas leiostraca, Strain SAG 11-49" /LENGTH=65 /DNA_ID=CAMNT_0049537865 /DNA_START=59 /DNA_END=254 /DNA_ORIENTATION=+
MIIPKAGGTAAVHRSDPTQPVIAGGVKCASNRVIMCTAYRARAHTTLAAGYSRHAAATQAPAAHS